ncbi:MAG: hypothetical protein JWO77_3778 [Ilumatobacteraceae bacterium]|nr:hypothetical protein [Ilumatobacteraceae bacterium]
MARTVGGPERVRVRLTGAASALIVLAAFALLFWLFSDIEVQLAIATAIIVGVIVDAVLAWRAVGPVTVDLRCPDEVPVGEPSRWTAQVLGWSRPLALTPLLTLTRPDLVVAHDRLGEFDWPELRRGVVPFALLDAVATGPLGLATAGRRHLVALPTPLHVTPKPIETDVRWPRARAVGFGMNEGSPIGDDLFRSVRPYQSGDERRRVHWKATAHHGELMVRESDGLGVVLVRVIVDLGMPGTGAELAAGRAVWVATAAIERGWAVELTTLDASSEIPRIERLGHTFGPPPSLLPPPLVPLPTVTAPVRTAKEVRRRLATAAYGQPVAPSGSGWRGLICRVDREGVHWS